MQVADPHKFIFLFASFYKILQIIAINQWVQPVSNELFATERRKYLILSATINGEVFGILQFLSLYPAKESFANSYRRENRTVPQRTDGFRSPRVPVVSGKYRRAA